MTVFTKPGLIIKKKPLLSENQCDEVAVTVDPPTPRMLAKKRASAATLLCFSLSLALLALLGVVVSLQLFEQTNNKARRVHYQGYCSIPVSKDMQILESRKMALHLKEAENAPTIPAPDIQVLTLSEDTDMSDVLREMLDINVDDSMERIAVYSDGRSISFLHDFTTNVTGIADQDRCFLMELDPEVVLAPSLFVMGLQQGEEFDVGVVRSRLRALLPRVRDVALAARGLADRCRAKPVYRLSKDAPLVRKRSAADPPRDYIHFAGRNVQEISISNMAELLHYEAAQGDRPQAPAA